MTADRLNRIVVVGGSIAGMTAIDTLRDAGFEGQISLLSEESHEPYSRPALSKAAFTAGFATSDHMLSPTSASHDRRAGVSATRLDVVRQTIATSDNDTIAFDALVIASGARARKLDDVGAADHGVHEITVRTLDDAVALRQRLTAGSRQRVLIVGAGILGMELASGCLELGCEVVIFSRSQPLVHQLGRFLSGYLTRAAVEAGLKVVVDQDIRLVGRGTDVAVRTSDNATHHGDVVITAIGDVPNHEWLAGTGLLTSGALRADSSGRVRGLIVAAGDVAMYPGPRGHRRTPFWTNAIEQATIAARTLLGADTGSTPSKPYFWTEQFGLTMRACGELPVAGEPQDIADSLRSSGALLAWGGAQPTTAAAINYKIAVPALRALLREPALAPAGAPRG